MSGEEQVIGVEQVNGVEAPVEVAPEEVTSGPPEEWGEDISSDGDKGLFKKILTPGSGVEKPMAGNEVIVHYTGRLLNGEVFDSSVERDEKFKFKLGEGRVIKGWDVGVATMLRGEKCILTCTPEYAYGKTGSPPKIGPNETLQFEVELFDWRGEDITEDGGVIKHVISKGETYSTPEEGSAVEAHVRGTVDGRVFQEGDITFDFGEGCEKGVVSGLEKAIGTMVVNDVVRVIVKSEYAYGEEGNAELGIPGGADLVYEVRLNNFTKAKEPWDYENLEERLADTTLLKERGGRYFKEGKFALAQKLYDRAANLITDTSIRKEETKEEAKPLRVALHLNLAACHLKLRDPTAAIKECDEVLTEDCENVKAFFRKGQAHQALQNFDEAIEAFQKVLALEPSNKAAKNQLILTRKMVKDLKEKEKKRYANMFEKLSAHSENEQEQAPKSEEPPNAAEINAEDPPITTTDEPSKTSEEEGEAPKEAEGVESMET